MTIRAAGMLLTTKDSGRALFLKRSPTSDHPGEWCLPGGGIEAGETAEEAAEREVKEEIGEVTHSNPVLWTRRVAMELTGEEVDFTTFRAIVADEFVPKLNGEHSAYAWASVSEPPEPLHPGVRVALDRLTMDELGVARAMAAGELTSPQKYGNFWLFTIRISGTGLSYRESLDEYVWRDENYYTDPEFLARCNGLPVVMGHPEKKPSLDSAEFNKRIIGTVFVPFVKGAEAWAVAKIWDKPSAELMASTQMSTSPGVVFFREGNPNETLTLSDGSTLLLEGRPHVLDHCAVCEAGVWDKAGPPTGVTSSLVKDFLDMTTEEQAAADKARNDAATMLTKIHDSLTQLSGRMDSMEAARKDAEAAAEKERNDKARHDTARKDKFGRKDGESYKDWTQRCDADEMAMMDELMKGGCEPDTAKKDAAAARMDAGDELKRMDAESFEKWKNEEKSEEDKKADAARKDAEEKAEKERMDASRKDATTAENAELRTRLAAMEATIKGFTAETPASELDAIAAAHSRADSVAAMFGDRAPPHIPGETPVDYRRRLINRFKAHSRLKDSRFDSLDSATLAPLEDVVYADAVEAARAPAKAAVGRLVPFERKDRAGRTITEYHGDIKAFLAPFTRSAIRGKFTNPNGRL